MTSARRAAGIIGLCLCLGIALFRIHALATTYFIGRATEASQATLSLIAEAVDTTVAGYAPIPGLVAADPTIRKLLDQDTALGNENFLNEKLRYIARSMGASEIYVMDRTGLTVATSNYRDTDSFLGRNFSYRPYFSKALAGSATTYHALGSTSGERGFFFAAPILDGIRVVGVVATKVTAASIEKEWMGDRRDVLITDENGIIFLSNRPEFQFQTLQPLTEPLRRQIADTQQFPLEELVPFEASADVIGPEVQVDVVRQGQSARFLSASVPLKRAGWHAVALTPIVFVQRPVMWTMLLCVVTVTAAVLAFLLTMQRRAHIAQRIEFEQRERVLLERKVLARTADLDKANTNLREEVAVRRRAEERLRASQKELVQAGKLAALGKMSAAISHEINQPLTAIKSYAVNAAEYLARARVDEAKQNIHRISEMSDRMSEISQHLRIFARQPGDDLKPINLPEVIRETIVLVGPQMRAHETEILFQPPEGEVWALGGKLRLQQVLVNILTNAMEAMNGEADSRIEIGIDTDNAQEVKITLRDFGPGIPKDNLDLVFDAFYTTKEAGIGMGLGMSISHNIISDFGGALSAGNHPERGAVFTVTLKRYLRDLHAERAS